MAKVNDVNCGYLLGFVQNSTTFGGTYWAKRVDDNSCNLGIATKITTGTATTYTTCTHTAGPSYGIVVSYIFNTGTPADDIAKLGDNPAYGEEATPMLTDTNAAVDLTQIASFFLRSDNITEISSAVVDNLKIVTTFAILPLINKFSVFQD